MTGDDTTLQSALSNALDNRDATAFVHVGPPCDPIVRYCYPDPSSTTHTDAIAFDGATWLRVSADESRGHPAETLADRLADRVGTGTVLTLARIPHDAALYLEGAGFTLASTAAIDRARTVKTPTERDRIETAQRAASAGISHGIAMLAQTATDDGRLVTETDGTPDDETTLTADRLRRAIDEAIVAAGGFPMGQTTVSPASGGLEPGVPIVLSTAPRSVAGYYGGLTRTLVVASDGGRERRAHVGVTQAFRSVESMLTADTESVTAVEADLEAEIRAFGFGDAESIETRVAGVGLEPTEAPRAGSDEVGPGSVVRIEAGVELEPGQWVRLADILAVESDGVRWLDAPSRSISPSA